MVPHILSALALGFAFLAPPALAERPYINDKKAPSDLEDLRFIEGRLTKVLPAARKATVCIELGKGGSGSGVIVSKEGLILTAAHVTGGVGRELTVIFEDGRKVKAESLGLHAETDAAMARITEEGSYPFVEVDRERRSKLGDWVFSLGHSGGFDKDRGSVVRLGRLIRTSDNTVQSDCDLIGGDSGGPLFDLHGRLIGIHSRVGSRVVENMHVPLRVFDAHWDGLESGEFIGEGPFASKPKVGRAYLGIRVAAREEGGVIVEKVGRESPAEAAGFEEGDIIFKVDDQPLASRDDLKDFIKEKAPEEQVAFELLRKGARETLTLRLGDRDE